MMFMPWGGFGPLGHILTTVIAGVWFIVVFVVTVGLLFLLVRFLLVGTRAAQIYVARNAPVVVPPAAEPDASADATPTSTSTVTEPLATPGTKSATRPAAKPRTPKD